jgi:hypothetical protein
MGLSWDYEARVRTFARLTLGRTGSLWEFAEVLDHFRR